MSKIKWKQLICSYLFTFLEINGLLGDKCIPSITEGGRFFNGISINSLQYILDAISAPHVYGCDNVCKNRDGCLAVSYNQITRQCTLFNSTNVINVLVNDTRAITILRIPQDDCKDIVNSKTEGWTILQRRLDGSVNFYRNWFSYKEGFGNICGEFWLGLDAAHTLTNGNNVTLRFDLWYGNEYAYMEYYEATISDESDNYRLDYNGMSGNAGDSMTRPSKNSMFSTKDRDNDEYTDNCAILFTGAWWYKECHEANLNGQYDVTDIGQGINWNSFKGLTASMTKTEIRIKLNK